MKKRWWSSLLMFAWLVLGYGVIHFLVIAWLAVVIQNRFLGPSDKHRSLIFPSDMDPVIMTYHSDSNRHTFERLDGTPLELPSGKKLRHHAQINLASLEDASRMSWEDRISTFSDFGSPSVYWYFLVPPENHDSGYFVGYDPLLRRKMGYIDVHGFTSECPTRELSFPVHPRRSARDRRIQGMFAAVQWANNLNPGALEPSWMGNNLVDLTNATSDSVWLLSQDKIYEIRLGPRTVRCVIENQSGMTSLYNDVIYSGNSQSLRLIARTTSGLLVIDPETGHALNLQVGAPEDAVLEIFRNSITRDEFECESGEYVFATYHSAKLFDQMTKVTVSKMDPEGVLINRQDVRVSSGQGTMSGLLMTFLAPSTLYFVALIAFLSSIDTTSTPFYDYAAHFWFPAAISILIGLMTGWSARRREREVFGESSWFWPVMVGLCGWFGWVAYVCLRPLPARLSTGHWMTSTPDPITPMGIEIFG